MKKILMAALSAAVALTMSPCAFAEALPEASEDDDLEEEDDDDEDDAEETAKP